MFYVYIYVYIKLSMDLHRWFWSSISRMGYMCSSGRNGRFSAIFILGYMRKSWSRHMISLSSVCCDMYHSRYRSCCMNVFKRLSCLQKFPLMILKSLMSFGDGFSTIPVTRLL